MMCRPDELSMFDIVRGWSCARVITFTLSNGNNLRGKGDRTVTVTASLKRLA